MTDDHSHAAMRLSPWNPLDHLRLLGWLFLAPARLDTYRESAGEEAVRRGGAWLSSTLLWVPLFMITLALLGILSVLFGAFMALAWALTGWLGKYDYDDSPPGARLTALVLALVLAGLVAGGLGFRATVVAFILGEFDTAHIARVVAIILAFGVAVGVPSGAIWSVAGGMSRVTVRVIALSVAAGGLLGVLPLFWIGGIFRVAYPGTFAGAIREAAVMVALFAAFIIPFFVPLITTSHVAVILRESRDAGVGVAMRVGALAALALSYTVLMWLCSLGGWELREPSALLGWLYLLGELLGVRVPLRLP